METKIKLLNNGEIVRKKELPKYEFISVAVPMEGFNGEDYLSVVKSIPACELRKTLMGLMNEYVELEMELVKIKNKRWLKDKNTGAMISDSKLDYRYKKFSKIEFALPKNNVLTNEGREFARSLGKVNFILSSYIQHLYEEQEAIKNQQAIERLVREQRKETA